MFKFKPVGLRRRIFTLFALITIFLLLGVSVLVERRFTDEMRDNLIDNLQNAAEVYQTYTRIRMNRLINQTANISADARLQASLSTGDERTISQTVNEINRLLDADLFLVLSDSGRYLSGEGLIPGDRLNLSRSPAVRDAINNFDSGDHWTLSNNLLEVAAIPIVTGQRVQGVLVVGFEWDNDFIDELRKMTECHLTFLVNDQVPYSSYYVMNSAETATLFKPLVTGSVPFDFRGDSERFTGIRVPVLDARDNEIGSLFIYKSLDATLASLVPLRWNIVIIALLGIVLTLLSSWAVARGVSRPVEDLVTAVRDFGAGNYDNPVAISSQDEIGSLAKAFEEMRQSLLKAREELVRSERLSTVGRMANGIIHDFKQPITAITGYTELLTRQGQNEAKRKDYSNRIQKALDRMIAMVNELLEYARGDESPLNLQKVNLNELVAESLSMMQQSLDDKQVEAGFERGKIDLIDGDPSRLLRVVENLIGNARDALPEGGRIEVNTRRTDDGVELSIADNGRGIPDNIKESIFEPFITTGKATGTGLGLAITKKIVEEHNGEISFNPRENGGTTFYVRLPETRQ